MPLVVWGCPWLSLVGGGGGVVLGRWFDGLSMVAYALVTPLHDGVTRMRALPPLEVGVSSDFLMHFGIRA